MYGRRGYGGTGDYYAGDYYAGDPGLFSFLGRAAGSVFGSFFGLGPKAAAPAVPSNIGIMAPGGGVINASAAGQNPGSVGAALEQFMAAHPLLSAGASFVGGTGLGAALGLIKTGGMPLPGTAMVRAGMYGGRRMHPNKSTYVVRGGGTSRYPRGLNVVLKGTALVPTRRMNVANPRALRRSLRRVAGFAKLTKRVRRAVSLAASAVGVHRRGARKAIRRR